MRELGFHVTTFEQSDAIGGNWRYRSLDDPFAAVSASYQSLRTNTTRDGTAFSDFPMPDSYPLFPAHHEILAYLIDYAAHYRITDHVRFRHKVVSVEPELHADDGSVISEGDDALAGASSWIEPHLKWRVTYDDYSSLVHGSAPSMQQDPSARAVEPTRNTAVFDAIIVRRATAGSQCACAPCSMHSITAHQSTLCLCCRLPMGTIGCPTHDPSWLASRAVSCIHTRTARLTLETNSMSSSVAGARVPTTLHATCELARASSRCRSRVEPRCRSRATAPRSCSSSCQRSLTLPASCCTLPLLPLLPLTAALPHRARRSSRYMPTS